MNSFSLDPVPEEPKKETASSFVSTPHDSSSLTETDETEQFSSDLVAQDADSDLGPGQFVLLPEGASRADAVKVLSTNITLNEYQLPDFFYRSDLLPFPLTNMTLDDADAAVVPLEYYEGYPTYGGGKVFWYQLDHEPYDSFILFQKYLDQAMEYGLRQLQLLAMNENMTMARVTALANEYMWAWRARAYDLFQVAADRKRRDLRARAVENKHYNKAGDLLTALEAKYQGTDWIDELSAKEGIELMTTLMKIQRMSVGLAANGNAGGSQFDPAAAASGADIMKEVVRGLSGSSEGLGIDNNLKALLADPQFAFNAQALVIQVRSGANAGGEADLRGQQQSPTPLSIGGGSAVIDADHKVIP